ncbi:PREDICTED: amino-acid permease [Prunus dulcis]|uniref:PREDICTED: amino-acid permease n=1 Tax=Prunus dulcis TaxID=3755 RepID=A0A5E4EI45_PRUDU|nr:PREDICTED: amino-acid permease [Prunus dulcis]
MDSGEKRLNELGYKQELRREMTQFKTMAITFSCISAFSGTPLYGQSLRYAGPATLVWGWMVVSFFTWFVAIAMAEICSSFPLETIGVIFAIGAQAYSGSQALQMIILLATGTNKGGGYFASKGVFLCLATSSKRGVLSHKAIHLRTLSLLQCGTIGFDS